MTRTSDNTEKAVSTDVLIGGKVYSLAGADAEHLQRVAALLNSKLVEVRGTACGRGRISIFSVRE